jgi:hypothetical protein
VKHAQPPAETYWLQFSILGLFVASALAGAIPDLRAPVIVGWVALVAAGCGALIEWLAKLWDFQTAAAHSRRDRALARRDRLDAERQAATPRPDRAEYPPWYAHLYDADLRRWQAAQTARQATRERDA